MAQFVIQNGHEWPQIIQLGAIADGLPIAEDAASVGSAQIINFIGVGVSVAVDGGDPNQINVTIPGGPGAMTLQQAYDAGTGVILLSSAGSGLTLHGGDGTATAADTYLHLEYFDQPILSASADNVTQLWASNRTGEGALVCFEFSSGNVFADPSLVRLLAFNENNTEVFSLRNDDDGITTLWGGTETVGISLTAKSHANVSLEADVNILVSAVGSIQINGGSLGFFGVSEVVQQSGSPLTNNVSVSGTINTIDNFTDLVVYANDAATIHGNFYQLARTLKEVTDALLAYGLLISL
jgi:hypothetical protein